MRLWDIDNKVYYTIHDELEWKKGRDGGWMVQGKPDRWKGDAEKLETFYIDDEVLHELIIKTRQPRELNIKKYKKKSSDKDVDERVIDGDNDNEESVGLEDKVYRGDGSQR